MDNPTTDVHSEQWSKAEGGAVALGLLRPGMGSTSVIYYQCDLKQGTAPHGITDFSIYEMKITTLEGTLRGMDRLPIRLLKQHSHSRYSQKVLKLILL